MTTYIPEIEQALDRCVSTGKASFPLFDIDSYVNMETGISYIAVRVTDELIGLWRCTPNDDGSETVERIALGYADGAGRPGAAGIDFHAPVGG